MIVRGAPLTRLRHGDGRWEREPVATGDPYALCRCGASGSMPLCDRKEPYECFEEEPSSAAEPGPFTWDVPDPSGPPAVGLKPGGPARVAGDVAIAYGEASLVGRDRWSLCRCGASRCQPVCDSTHTIVGFEG